MARSDVTEAPGRAAEEEAGCRPLRADAQRNRRRILEAAEATFATEGIAVPVDVVAERAGVGVGTLYRHFPTKEALFEAIVLQKLDDLECAVRVGEDAEPTAAFFSFLMQMADEASLKHDLFDALAAAGIDFKSRCGDRVQAVKSALDDLRQRAVADGGVRPDVTTDQVMGLVIGAVRGIADPAMTDEERRRMVAIVCDGLRPPR